MNILAKNMTQYEPCERIFYNSGLYYAINYLIQSKINSNLGITSIHIYIYLIDVS